MFGKQALMTLTGPVIKVGRLTGSELFTLDLAFEVEKHPIWVLLLLFRSLVIYLFMEIARRTSKRSCPPIRFELPKRKRKQNGKLMQRNFIWKWSSASPSFPVFSPACRCAAPARLRSPPRADLPETCKCR